MCLARHAVILKVARGAGESEEKEEKGKLAAGADFYFSAFHSCTNNTPAGPAVMGPGHPATPRRGPPRNSTNEEFKKKTRRRRRFFLCALQHLTSAQPRPAPTVSGPHGDGPRPPRRHGTPDGAPRAPPGSHRAARAPPAGPRRATPGRKNKNNKKIKATTFASPEAANACTTSNGFA